MNDLIGALIPLLANGTDIKTIFRELSGANFGASYDGLGDMLRKQARNAIVNFPYKVNQSDIDAGVNAAMEFAGWNPYSGAGQGVSKVLGQLYHLAPGSIGPVIGIPDPETLFRQMANGAAGISEYSGGGSPSMFNPYSMMSSHKNAMDMAKRIYSLANDRGDGRRGYQLDFTHGLNMSEVGLMAQRLLTSNLPYQDENGNRLNLQDENDSKKFNENLKRLGSKFNEAASMLAKVTGSVEEAVNLMDRLAGGNFLGGTAEQAERIASRAKNMATAIRVTSAIAGMDPRESYVRISSLRAGISQAMGIDPAIAEQSGLSSLFENPAYLGTQAFNMWAASHKGASVQEKQQAWLGAHYRTSAFFSGNAKNLAALVAANPNLFSKDDLSKIVTALRMGRPDDIVPMVKDRMGEEKYNAYMNDPSAIMSAMMYGDKDLQNRLFSAGIEGNMTQAAVYGAEKDLELTLRDVGSKMNKLTGTVDDRYGIFRESAIAALRREAVKKGMSWSAAGNYNLDQLREYLIRRHDVDAREIDRLEKMSEIEGALGDIKANTMSGAEEARAKSILESEIDKSTHINADEKSRLKKMLREGTDLEVVFEELYESQPGSFSDSQLREKRSAVMGGKISRASAEKIKAMLDEQAAFQRVAATPDELRKANEAEARRLAVEKSGKLLGTISSKRFSDKKISDREAFKALIGDAARLSKSGDISLGGDNESLTETIYASAKDIIGSLIDGGLGDADKKSVEDIVAAFSDDVVSGVFDEEGAGNIKVAAEAALKNVISRYGNIIGKKGKNTVEKWISELNTPNSGISRKLNRDNWGASAVRILQKNTEDRLKERTDLTNDAFAYREGGRFAVASTKDASSAAMAGAADKAGLSFVPVVMEDGTVQLISRLDRSYADSRQNAWNNAIQGGAGSFRREAIEDSRKRYEDLREALGGVAYKTLERAAGGKEKDIEKIKGILIEKGRGDIEAGRDIEFLSALKESSFGGVNALEALSDKNKYEKARQGMTDDALLDVYKRAGRENSPAHDILSAIGGFTQQLAKLYSVPLPVTIKSIGLFGD